MSAIETAASLALLDQVVFRLLRFAADSALNDEQLPSAIHMIGQLARVRPHLAAASTEATQNCPIAEPELHRETMEEWNARHAPAPRGQLAA